MISPYLHPAQLSSYRPNICPEEVIVYTRYSQPLRSPRLTKRLYKYISHVEGSVLQRSQEASKHIMCICMADNSLEGVWEQNMFLNP